MFKGSMRNAGAMGMMAALMGASLLGGNTFGASPGFFPASKTARPCLRCGTMHQHNNCFCSAECCRSYAAEKKNWSRCQQSTNKQSTPCCSPRYHVLLRADGSDHCDHCGIVL